MSKKAKSKPILAASEGAYKTAFICSLIAGISYLLFSPWWLEDIGIKTIIPTTGLTWAVRGALLFAAFIFIASVCELVKIGVALSCIPRTKEVMTILVPTIAAAIYLGFVAFCYNCLNRLSYDLLWGGLAVYFIVTAVFFWRKYSLASKKKGETNGQKGK